MDPGLFGQHPDPTVDKRGHHEIVEADIGAILAIALP